METKKDEGVENLGVKAGLLISLALVAYFLLMKLVGLIQYPELRALNFLILLGGLILMHRYQRIKTGHSIDYLSGLLLGLTATVVAVVPFSVFVLAYLSEIDPALLLEIKRNSPMLGYALNPATATTTVLVEGISSGMVMSFSLMQYFKSVYVNKHLDQHH